MTEKYMSGHVSKESYILPQRYWIEMDWKQHKCSSIYNWKIKYGHIYRVKFYSAIKKDKNLNNVDRAGKNPKQNDPHYERKRNLYSFSSVTPSCILCMYVFVCMHTCALCVRLYLESDKKWLLEYALLEKSIMVSYTFYVNFSNKTNFNT
jgi:hypothetical protein